MANGPCQVNIVSRNREYSTKRSVQKTASSNTHIATHATLYLSKNNPYKRFAVNSSSLTLVPYCTSKEKPPRNLQRRFWFQAAHPMRRQSNPPPHQYNNEPINNSNLRNIMQRLRSMFRRNKTNNQSHPHVRQVMVQSHEGRKTKRFLFVAGCNKVVSVITSECQHTACLFILWSCWKGSVALGGGDSAPSMYRHGN